MMIPISIVAAAFVIVVVVGFCLSRKPRKYKTVDTIRPKDSCANIMKRPPGTSVKHSNNTTRAAESPDKRSNTTRGSETSDQRSNTTTDESKTRRDSGRSLDGSDVTTSNARKYTERDDTVYNEDPTLYNDESLITDIPTSSRKRGKHSKPEEASEMSTLETETGVSHVSDRKHKKRRQHSSDPTSQALELFNPETQIASTNINSRDYEKTIVHDDGKTTKRRGRVLEEQEWSTMDEVGDGAVTTHKVGGHGAEEVTTDANGRVVQTVTSKSMKYTVKGASPEAIAEMARKALAETDEF